MKGCPHGFLTRSDTNRAVHPQKTARSLKFWILKVEGFYYLCNEKKALISCTVTARLICTLVFAYAKKQVSHDAAHIDCTTQPVKSFMSTGKTLINQYICHSLTRTLCGALDQTLGFWLYIVLTARTDQTRLIPRLIWVHRPFYEFCHAENQCHTYTLCFKHCQNLSIDRL